MTHAMVGSYTEPGMGNGTGVSRLELGDDGLLGSVQGASFGLRNPSFLALAGGVPYAVEELADGGLAALDPKTLAVTGRAPSGGADPCHLMVLDGNLWAANYSSGTASVTPLEALGAGTSSRTSSGAYSGASSPDSTTAAAPVLLSHPGSGPVADRQGESHAHQVTATPWGTVLVSDLGADRVDEYSATSQVLLGSAEMPPGSGPRHVVLKGDFLLVAGELDGCLHVLRRTPLNPDDPAGTGHFWHWLFKAPLAGSEAEIAQAEQFFPSHLQLSDDSSRVFAAVRGPDTLVVLDVGGLDGETPVAPSFLAQVPSGGNWPRHFAVGSEKIYVANQMSNNIAVFKLGQDGLPEPEPVQTLDIGSPACIVLA
ncbi:MAG: beta-propeller fold lactonase family protein [Specibacter sp.]